MDPVGLQPDAEPAVEPAIHLPDNAGKLGVRTIGRNGLQERIICQPPAIIPASNQQASEQQVSTVGERSLSIQATGSLRMAKEDAEHGHQTGKPDRRGKSIAGPQRQQNAGHHHPTWIRIRRSGIRRMMVFSSPFQQPLLRMPPVSDDHAQPARYRPAKPISEALTDHERCHAFCPLPNRFPAYWRGTHGAFNWLFARHHGGRYLLRIEDTDRQRRPSTPSRPFMTACPGLALRVTSRRSASRHAPNAMPKSQLPSSRPVLPIAASCRMPNCRRFVTTHMPPATGPLALADRTDWPDAPCVVRMRMPDDGEITIEDAVQGTVTVRNENLDDMVILRGDGTPTYMLAVVVDDHDMGVTHVIRGDDHLNNAFRQSMVYRGMGWNVPVFAHIR